MTPFVLTLRIEYNVEGMNTQLNSQNIISFLVFSVKEKSLLKIVFKILNQQLHNHKVTQNNILLLKYQFPRIDKNLTKYLKSNKIS